MELKIKSNKFKPIVNLDEPRIFAAMDTCAQMPVWTEDLDTLKSVFPDVEKNHRTVFMLGGFGGKTVPKQVYTIPRLIISKGVIELNNLPIVLGTITERAGFSMVFPLVAFQDILFTVSVSNGVFRSINCTNLDDKDIWCEPDGLHLKSANYFIVRNVTRDLPNSNWKKWLKYHDDNE